MRVNKTWWIEALDMMFLRKHANVCLEVPTVSHLLDLYSGASPSWYSTSTSVLMVLKMQQRLQGLDLALKGHLVNTMLKCPRSSVRAEKPPGVVVSTLSTAEHQWPSIPTSESSMVCLRCQPSCKKGAKMEMCLCLVDDGLSPQPPTPTLPERSTARTEQHQILTS